MTPSPLPSRIAFVGGGNMARSLVGGLVARGVDASRLCVSEPQAAARESLQRELGVATVADNLECVRDAGLVLLAVKPQVMREVCTGLAGQLVSAIVVSIAAGITCDQLRRWLQHGGALVRCMPNTPALLGAGATGLYAAPGTTAQQREAAEAVLAAVGRCVWIDDESQMDTVTALSGSGPAYVFLLAEALQQAAQAEGLPAQAAVLLTRQTLLGAARMLDESGEAAADLRQRVTSPGGTTQAALESFEADGLRQVVARAVHAARLRGAELSQQFGD